MDKILFNGPFFFFVLIVISCCKFDNSEMDSMMETELVFKVFVCFHGKLCLTWFINALFSWASGARNDRGIISPNNSPRSSSWMS